jgi:hypothetical protein
MEAKMATKQYGFGTGEVYALAADGTSYKFGTIQDLSVEFSFDKKGLYGQLGFPVATARGKGKIEGKIATADIDIDTWNAIFFGEAAVTGASRRSIRNEIGIVPSTPFAVTVANAANFYQDLGVRDPATGLSLVKVPTASTPTTGQYKVSAVGVYTFAAVDTGKSFLFDYTYNMAASGKRLDITNQLMGSIPVFQIHASSSFQGKFLTLQLFACTSDKLSMPFKQDDFLVHDIPFEAQANAADQIGFLSVS